MSLHKQLHSPDSSTDIAFLCIKIMLDNYCIDTETFMM